MPALSFEVVLGIALVAFVAEMALLQLVMRREREPAEAEGVES